MATICIQPLILFIQKKCLPELHENHNHTKDTNNNDFTIDQQYADDIGWAST